MAGALGEDSRLRVFKAEDDGASARQAAAWRRPASESHFRADPLDARAKIGEQTARLKAVVAGPASTYMCSFMIGCVSAWNIGSDSISMMFRLQLAWFSLENHRHADPISTFRSDPGRIQR